MRPGDRVLVVALWSSFWGYRGTVKALEPHVMVLFDGDAYPILIDPVSLAVEPGGAE